MTAMQLLHRILTGENAEIKAEVVKVGQGHTYQLDIRSRAGSGFRLPLNQAAALADAIRGAGEAGLRLVQMLEARDQEEARLKPSRELAELEATAEKRQAEAAEALEALAAA